MTLLQDLPSEAAQRRPDSKAVVMGAESLTYGELESASNRLANVLRAAGCSPGSRVALFLPKSIDAVVGMLGTLKAGGIYVPIDVRSPAPRVARIVASCDPSTVLLANRSVRLYTDVLRVLQTARAPRAVFLDDSEADVPGLVPAFRRRDLDAAPDETPPSRIVDTDPAHILFTSGSTGDPKGVIITHRNVLTFVDWARDYFGMAPHDRTSGHSPLHFDLSTFDIYGTFAAGARLHLVPPELNLLPQKLAAFIRESELTQWFSVPSALSFMAKFDVVRPADFPRLRRLLWCGEVLPTPTLIYWMERLPHVSFSNLYGPTEATIASSCYTVPECPRDPLEPIPIGTACRGERLRVLDGSLRPAPAGIVGDLYIEGVGLSPGYWKDPGKTDAVFVRNPFSQDPSGRIYKTGDLAKVGEDGQIRYLGRTDSQIKSRGHRIELGEIEAALHALDSLRESAVVAAETDGFEGVTICCAYAALPDRPVTSASLSTALRKVLPSYMIPRRWRALEVLPKNANGKIDRRRLREEFEGDATEAR